MPKLSSECLASSTWHEVLPSGPAAIYTTEIDSVAASLDICAGLGFLDKTQGGWILTSAGRSRLHICIMLSGPPTPMRLGRPHFGAMEKHTRTSLEHWLHLKDQGWTLEHRRSKRRAPLHYAPDGQKTAYIFGTVLSKFYFQTLAYAQEFFDLGMASITHTAQPTWYRKLFSESGEPRLPPPSGEGEEDIGIDVEFDESMGMEPSAKRRRAAQPRSERVGQFDAEQAEPIMDANNDDDEMHEQAEIANGDLFMQSDADDDAEEPGPEEVHCTIGCFMACRSSLCLAVWEGPEGNQNLGCYHTIFEAVLWDNERQPMKQHNTETLKFGKTHQDKFC